ncbi:MAG: WD40/YVTN/BNR-like repeat-containing protein, partial [Saprospiraceae bacterium]
HRVDRITQEQVLVQPQAGAGEDYERFNWDAPIIVSPHQPTRLYFASQRVWKSDDRGDSWTAISDDLTRDEERITLPIMGKQQSWDNPWDVGAMSNYNTITSLSESPIDAGVVYAGTDDGIIQVTENDGQTWRKIEVNTIPGVPKRAFINDIKADLHDANTVYVAMDNHKEGDFKSYLFKSSDRGRTWTNIGRDFPDDHLIWRVVQDHVKPELMFCATEFGIFFTTNSGNNWIKLKGGVPTIAFRDLAIQKRENDLVGASFGRSFFVLDDYSPLREISGEMLKKEASLFAIKDAHQYQPRSIAEYQGASEYAAKNPDFGAIFTYYLADGYTTAGAERKKKEGEAKKNQSNVPFPGWDELEKQRLEMPTKVWLVVKDSDNNIVRRVKAKAGKGFHRTAWDLRYAYKGSIKPGEKQRGGNSRWRRGFMAAPGAYTVTLMKEKDGEMTALSDTKSFNVKMLYKGALEGSSLDEIATFQKRMEKLMGEVNVAGYQLKTAKDRLAAMQTALERSEVTDMNLVKDVFSARGEVMRLDAIMNGNQSKSEIGERNNPTIRSRMFVGYRGLSTSYGPTENHLQQVKIAEDELAGIAGEISKVYEDVVPALEERLAKAGAPWIEGAER